VAQNISVIAKHFVCNRPALVYINLRLSQQPTIQPYSSDLISVTTHVQQTPPQKRATSVGRKYTWHVCGP
jgi:hypothetical protein